MKPTSRAIILTAIAAIAIAVTATAQTQTTMEEVRASILRDVGDTTERAVKPSDAPDFFGHGKARIVGYLKGYDTAKHNFSTVRFQLENILTRETTPLAAELTTDGWFTADIPLEYPKRVNLYIGSRAFPIYLEQESRLGVIIDMADLKLIEFIGPLGRLNRELHSFEPERFRYGAYTEAMERAAAMPPIEAAVWFREFRDRNLSAIDSLRGIGTISDDARRILRYVEYDYFGQLLCDFDMRNRDARREEPEKPELPVEYYSFLKDIPLNDPGLLTTGEWVFLNRYEYMAPLMEIPSIPFVLPTLYDYVAQREDVVLTAEDKEYKALLDSWNNLIDSGGQKPDSLFVAAFNPKHDNFIARYKKYETDYQEYLVGVFAKNEIEVWHKRNLYQDSIYYEVLRLPPSLFYDITKVRSVNARVKTDRKLDYCRIVSDAVSHPFLKDEVWRLYEQSLPKAGEEPGYVLPAGQATDALKAITDPHLGNLVLIDFWGTGCGPCVSHIRSDREQRDRLTKEGALTYVFISDDSWSPSKEYYDKFAEENGLTNHHRLKADDMNRFMQLFKFSGLPHWVLLGRDGRVLDDNFRPFGDVKQLLEKFNK
jgi:thiol-disulfide isomerase/thioredoxin